MQKGIGIALLLVFVALAGCLGEDEPVQTDDGADEVERTDVGPAIGNSTFLPPVESTPAWEAFVIDVAVHQGHGLYEPTIDVSPEGTIYVSAHSTAVGVFPSPSYVSQDDGASWSNMAFIGPLQNPGPGQTAGGLLSDEIFIVAGDNGQSWGVDINLHSFLISGWCDEGAELCYHNPLAYDHAQIAAEQGDSSCIPVPLKDRPWIAYSNDWVFIVNNPGGGPAQIASMRVPPAVPAEVGPVISDIQWNLCASSGGSIPGIPDLRPDGFFAMPQQQSGGYIVVTGNVEDIHSVVETRVMDNTHRAPAESDSTPSQISNYGQTAFDAKGTLFLSAMNNAELDDPGLHIAFSRDDGLTWEDRRFPVDQPVSMIYMDGNRYGPGALLHWGQIDGADTDYYVGHLQLNHAGELELRNVMLAFDNGPEASRHVQGAAAGPDGRAYFVMSDVSGNDNAAMASAIGTTPMRVVVQQDGPTLPYGLASVSVAIGGPNS